MLKSGDKAPAFTLLDQDGNEVEAVHVQGPQGARLLLPEGRHARLHDAGVRAARHRSATSATPSCSASAPTSRPSSSSSTRSTASASRCCPTPTTPSAEAFGVWGEKTMYGKKYMGIVRSAFLIDEKGKIAEAWYKISPARHAEEPARRARHERSRDARCRRRSTSSRTGRRSCSSTSSPRSCRASRPGGTWRLTGDEWFFAGHFPGRPDAARRADVRGDRPGRRDRRAQRRALRRQAAAVRRARQAPASAARSARATRWTLEVELGRHVGARRQGHRPGAARRRRTAPSPSAASSCSSSSTPERSTSGHRSPVRPISGPEPETRSGGGEDQRAVVAAEAEAVGQRRARAPTARASPVTTSR